MKSQITSVAAAVLLLSNPELAVDARKQLVGADEQRVASYKSPLV